RSLEIPAIVGTSNATQKINNGDFLILDGVNNHIYVNPDDATIGKLKKVQQSFLEDKAELEKLKDLPAVTLDGHQVEVCANIGSTKDIPGAERNGYEGVGLYRRSEEHTSELQSRFDLVCRLLL